ncbi:MAG: hypothetical protein LBU22_12430 [Dysgonamonadaceae bacterium]|jgi:hypothetical protein|nr:hypothetical protein [Dysgonamonadaceae bacterium]
MKNSEKQSVIEAPKVYESPMVEVLEVEVEKGFAQSETEPDKPSNPDDFW